MSSGARSLKHLPTHAEAAQTRQQSQPGFACRHPPRSPALSVECHRYLFSTCSRGGSFGTRASKATCSHCHATTLSRRWYTFIEAQPPCNLPGEYSLPLGVPSIILISILDGGSEYKYPQAIHQNGSTAHTKLLRIFQPARRASHRDQPAELRRTASQWLISGSGM